jgi:hypothetical protein
MSHVPYTVNVKDYICSELDRIRVMKKTMDFSSLMAIVERIQFHATSMENALDAYYGLKWAVKRAIEDEEGITDEEFRKRVTDAYKEMRIKNNG